MSVKLTPLEMAELESFAGVDAVKGERYIYCLRGRIVILHHFVFVKQHDEVHCLMRILEIFAST